MCVCVCVCVCILTYKYIYIVWGLHIYIQGSLNKFPDFFHLGTFIDSAHMKLNSPSK